MVLFSHHALLLFGVTLVLSPEVFELVFFSVANKETEKVKPKLGSEVPCYECWKDNSFEDKEDRSCSRGRTAALGSSESSHTKTMNHPGPQTQTYYSLFILRRQSPQGHLYCRHPIIFGNLEERFSSRVCGCYYVHKIHCCTL
jgi:hypothetical protein